MVWMATTALARSEEAPSEDLKQVLDTARAAMDQEFARAERFDSKARDRATLAGSWYAVVQAAAALSLSTQTHTWWIVGVAAEAVLGAIALVVVLYGTMQVAKLRTRPSVGEETLEAMKLAAGSDDFAAKSIDMYRDLLYRAQEANDQRADALDRKRYSWWPVLLIGVAELLTALLSRAVG